MPAKVIHLKKGLTNLLEAIKDQQIAVRMLEHELQGNNLPGALLFHGPDGCGKFLTALEIARSVNCRSSGAQDCVCPSCKRVRKLISKDVFLICKSNLRNTFSLWKRAGIKSKYVDFFLSDVRRLALSIYDEKPFARDFSKLEDIIRFPGDLINNFEKVIECVHRILDSLKGRLIAINRIREVQRFLSVKSGDGNYKVVIIDGAEHMNEEASNSFLKISEETPPNSLIIITTVDKDRLKETIKSRFRSYRFTGLTPDVLTTVFKDRFGFEGEDDFPKRTYDMDVMKEYHRRLSDQGFNLKCLTDIIGEIITGSHTVGLLSYMIDILGKKIPSLYRSDMNEVYEIESSIKTLSSIKRSILNSNINQEVALTDIMLNNLNNILK